MIDVLIELILGFLEFLGWKKVKKKDAVKKEAQANGSVCAGCKRRLEKDIIYELGKRWCNECYKIHVLKVKS